MDPATGVPRQGYSVTIPPFASGDPFSDNASFTPDAGRLGWLNVKYVVSEFEQISSDLLLINQISNSRIYQNALYRPRAWIQGKPDVQLEPGADSESYSLKVAPMLDREIEILEWTPNRIRLTAQGPGLLVLSEVMYPGWQVEVAGQPESILPVEGLLRGVLLEKPGSHQVTFIFRPIWIYIGLILQLVTLFGLLWVSFRAVQQPKQI